MFNLFRKPADSAPDLRDAVGLVAAGKLTLVDIRDPSEIKASGKAAGALTIPLSVLRMKADPASPEHDKRLKPDAPIAVYCASGARSSMAKQTLEGLGYAHVMNLGGLRDWHAAGGAVVR